MSPIKRINVTRSSMPAYEEYCEMIKPIFETKHLTNMGQLHNRLADELKAFFGVDNLSLFTNGHQALLIALKALGLTGEVITTPFTFASTTHAISDAKLTPVFCDIRRDNFTIDADKIEALITEKTSAILPVHVYGNVCDTKKLQKIADKYKLKLIYDAAHVFATKVDGHSVAEFGDVSMFSFHATKVFNTIEGGCLVYKDKALEKAICAIRNFGLGADSETVEFVGTNAKMNEFQAAMGLCNLKHLDEEIAKRKKAYDRYIKRLGGIEGIYLCPEDKRLTYNYAYLPVVFYKEKFGKDRDEVLDTLKQNNIYARRYFYPATNEFPIYKGKLRGETPIARDISQNVLTLPMYAELLPDEVDFICDVILKGAKQ